MIPALRHHLVTALLASLATPGLAQQSIDDAPSLRFGVSTGLTTNSNRGLDVDTRGTTVEAFTRFDFGATFATPIQQLDLSGDITLRALDGPERDSLSEGLVDPNLRLAYTRTARDAELRVTAFARQSEVTTATDEIDLISLESITDDATRLQYGFDTALELRRQAPFGVTLSTGYTGLRFSDTSAASTLTDQDRFRFGVALRFDINPTTRATLDARLSTFEDDGTDEGRRDTFALNGTWRQTLPTGSVAFRAGATFTEDGERYSLSAARTASTELWEVTGRLGASLSVDGDLFPIGEVNVTHTLATGALSANLSRSLNAGSDDEEQRVTSVGLSYNQQITALTQFNLNATYRETDPTGDSASSSFGTVGVSVQHTLAPGWQMNVGFDRRVSDTSTRDAARDNRLSIFVRRDLTARR